MVHPEIKSSRTCTKKKYCKQHIAQASESIVGKTSCKLVEAGNDPAAFFQPVEHTFNNLALPGLGAIKESRQPPVWFAFHAALKNHWLYFISVTIAA